MQDLLNGTKYYKNRVVSSCYRGTGYAAIKRLEGVLIELMFYRVVYVTGYLEVHALYSD